MIGTGNDLANTANGTEDNTPMRLRVEATKRFVRYRLGLQQNNGRKRKRVDTEYVAFTEANLCRSDACHCLR